MERYLTDAITFRRSERCAIRVLLSSFRMFDRFACFSSLVTLLILTVATTGHSWSGYQNESLLVLSRTLHGSLANGEERSFRVVLEAGQYSCVTVSATGVGLGITVIGPAGVKLNTVRARSDRPTPISLIAPESGSYRVSLKSLEHESFSGEYSIQLNDIRVATRLDKLRVSSGRLAAEGDRLSATGTRDALNSAIMKYEQALRAWRVAGDRIEEGYILKQIGEIHYQLGRPAKALEYYNRALSLSRDLKKRELECETLGEIGRVLRHVGKNELARQRCTEALNLSRELGHRRGEAKALAGIGGVLYAQGERQKSIDYYRQALDIWSNLRDRPGQAQTLLEIGDSYGELNEEEKAAAAYNEALGFWRSSGDRRGQVIALSAIGYLASRSGRKQEALGAYNQAMVLLRAVGDPIAEAGIMNGIAYVYEELGEKDIALEYLGKAEKIYRWANYQRGQTAFLISAAQIYFTKRQFKKSLNLLQQAFPSLASLQDQALESYAYKTAAAVYNALGEKSEALTYYEKALSLSVKLEDPRAESYALSGLAEIWAGRGEREKALTFLNRALVLNRATRDRVAEISTLFGIARIGRDLGRLADARATLVDSTEKIESLRGTVSDPDLRSSFIAAVRQNYELHIDVLMRLGRLEKNEEFEATALHMSERSRARSLVDMLAEAKANLRQGVDPTLLEREHSLQQALDAKMGGFSKLLAGRHTEEQLSAAGKRVDEATLELQQIQTQIRSSSPRYAALTQPQLLTLNDIQQQILDSDTLLLEYALGDDSSYLWAVTSNSFCSFQLPRRQEIEAGARRVYELLTVQNQKIPGETPLQKERRVARANDLYAVEASALSQMLLGPVASQLGARRLLIVADGALQYIPFGALPTPSSQEPIVAKKQPDSRQAQSLSSGTPLIVDHEVVSVPSMSTLAVIRRELVNRKPAAKAVAVLADPVFSAFDSRVGQSNPTRSLQNPAIASTREFDRATREVRVSRKRGGVARLPFSREEATAIISAAPRGQSLQAVDFDASRAMAVSSELKQYRIVHFATHGLLNSEHPELSGLIFSLVDRRGRPQNGFLRLSDVYELELPAKLVVLSACQTGLGKDVKGEGIIGLTRGFMYAGAARVVASLWQVDDSATAELMQRFYIKMFRDGLRPAAALREAQVEMWRQNKWKTPYYWAGFALQGEWN